MQLPFIHPNGTAKESLVIALCKASEALGVAISKLRKTAPNWRDYYPISAEAFNTATADYLSRMKRLDEVSREIDALMVAIDGIE